jgi:Pentapeptide repeats (8 copies)
LRGARLEGANLRRAQLQGADLRGAQLQGADLRDANVWLASFPRDLANQSPVPLGLADLRMSPLTADAKAELRQEIQARIGDAELFDRVIDRLYPILRDDPPKWEDEEIWNEYIHRAKEPSTDELIQFLAYMACSDPWGNIAVGMARRAEVFLIESKRLYAKSLAQALLKSNCEGMKALTDEMRATLESLASATE